MTKLQRKILIRVDASSFLGLGHLRRMTGLAEVLKTKFDCQVVFAANNDSLFNDLEKDYKVLRKSNETHEHFLQKVVESETPWLVIIDQKHDYQTDVLLKCKQHSRLVFVDCALPCTAMADLVIMPNLHYDQRGYCQKVLWGPNFVLLGQHVYSLPKRTTNSESWKNIVVSSGGSDPTAVTLKIMAWAQNQHEFNFNFLIGQSFLPRAQLPKQYPSHYQVNNYSIEQILSADACIVTFGVTPYELMYLGIPFALVAHSIENDQGAKRLCGVLPETNYLGFAEQLNQDSFDRGFSTFVQTHEAVRTHIQDCRAAVATNLLESLYAPRS